MTDAFDVLILGGGTAGCVLASLLSEDEGRSVCLVEAGPDYGPFDPGEWPADILDGRPPSSSHDWRDDRGPLPVARVLGGCSAHNMCTLMHAAPSDYDAWAELTGDATLGGEAFAPYLRRAEQRMTRRRFGEAELDPWFRGVAAASGELGLAVHDDLNDAAATEGLGRLPFNLEGTTRWNAAFGYLDPARGRPNRTLVTDALVERLALDGERATGAEVVTGGAASYFHPVATSAIGVVVDSTGRVHGFENLHVVDASIIPRPLRAGPNLTVMALAERMAESLGAADTVGSPA